MKLVYSDIVLAGNIGINGNLFGGVMMSWLDKAASLYVSDIISSQDIVTARFNELNFIEKVKEKEVVRIYAKTEKIGNTSITVKLKGCKVKYIDYVETEIDVVETSAVFVHIDKNGNSKKINNAKIDI